MKQNKHQIKLDGVYWLSPTRYGEFFGKTRQSVDQVIRAGDLRKKKHAGRIYVAGLPPASWSVKPELLEEWNLVTETWLEAPAPNETKPKSRRPPDLNFEKARKMAAEAELAELKLEEKKGELARNTAEMVIEIFRDSFVGVIEHLYELDLNKAQLAKLRTLYRGALDDMKRRLEERGLAGAEPEEPGD
jgi:hypothetical protein